MSWPIAALILGIGARGGDKFHQGQHDCEVKMSRVQTFNISRAANSRRLNLFERSVKCGGEESQKLEGRSRRRGKDGRVLFDFELDGFGKLAV
jgi:hypothetical protein